MKRTNPIRIVFVRNDHKITEMERKQENASLLSISRSRLCWIWPTSTRPCVFSQNSELQVCVCSLCVLRIKMVWIYCKTSIVPLPYCFCSNLSRWDELIGVNWDYNFVIELMRGSPCLWLLVRFIMIWFWILYLHYSLSSFSVRSVSNIYRTWSLHLSFIIISDDHHHHIIIIIMMHIWR